MSAIPYKEEVKRKLVHLSSLWIPLAMLYLSRETAILSFAFLLTVSLAVERMRSERLPYITEIYDFFFGRMLRQEPRPKQWIISGGPYVFAAALAVTLMVPAPAAAASMAVMLLGDTAAALIGRKFGKHRVVNGKSAEGCLAFLLAGFAGAMLFTGGTRPCIAALGVFCGMLAELFEKNLRIDDNFSIPVVNAAVWLFSAGGSV